VSAQAVSDVHSQGGTIPFWYWWSFAWVIDLLLYCCIIGFFGVNIHHHFKKTKTKVKNYAICQDCGHMWKL
jgi:hypothetical protein